MNRGSTMQVVLAGPYPHTGGMTGTFGRILKNMRTSSVLQEEVDFTPLRVTIPGEGSLPTRWIKDIARFTQAVRRKPDVLHFIIQKFRSIYREWPMITVARALGIKTVVDIRAGSLQYMLARHDHRLQNILMRHLLKQGDAVVLECPRDVTFVRERFGREAVHVPNALLEEDVLRVKPAQLPVKAGQPLKLIYSGRYTTYKGITTMLEAIDVLSARGLRAELHLTGQGNDADVLRMIEHYEEKNTTGNIVVDHGWDVPDLYDLLASAHVFVMPTHHRGEGHANSVTEAMNAGLGMILSDWPHREDIVPAQGALIIPPRDPVALADAVQHYIEEPAALAEAGRTNRKYVEDHYVDTACYPRFLELYRQLMAGPKS